MLFAVPWVTNRERLAPADLPPGCPAQSIADFATVYAESQQGYKRSPSAIVLIAKAVSSSRSGRYANSIAVLATGPAGERRVPNIRLSIAQVHCWQHHQGGIARLRRAAFVLHSCGRHTAAIGSYCHWRAGSRGCRRTTIERQSMSTTHAFAEEYPTGSRLEPVPARNRLSRPGKRGVW